VYYQGLSNGHGIAAQETNHDRIAMVSSPDYDN
jgi:hypothetical protein